MDIRFHLERLSLRHVLQLASRKLPRPFSYPFTNLDQALEAAAIRRATRATRRSRIRDWGEAAKLVFRPERTVLFYPQRPSAYHKVRTLCALSGFKMVYDPGRAYDVAFKFHASTFTPESELGGGVDFNGAVNGKSLDISKRAVARTFEGVFGYALALDPTTYYGCAVRKSDANATHDGLVIECPIPAASVEEGMVYERLVDTRTEDGFYINYRVAICRTVVPLVLVMYRPSDNRFDGTSHQEVVAAADVFTELEKERLGQFARAMHLDYGELDVLRDNGDGRIYVVDANNTPSTSNVGSGAGGLEPYKVRWHHALANAFADMVQEFDRRS